MRDLEQPLFGMGELVDRFLKLEQLGDADVALVVGVTTAFENGTSVGHSGADDISRVAAGERFRVRG
jgi:hypothetical protein